MDSNPDRPFKVLIAGGSLVGLSLALALEHAGIDYELFEKGQFAPQLGASIGMDPHSLRILDQLGVWKDIEKLVCRCGIESITREAATASRSPRLRRPVIFMERSKALEIVHDHIRDKSRLHAMNGVVGYEEIAHGVTVTTQDGAAHPGHILVGADEIHSQVRQLMTDKIRTTDLALSKELAQGFTSEYNCIFAVSRNRQFLPDGMVHNVYYYKYSAVAAAGVHGLVFWFLFVKASTQTTTPGCPRFNDDDAEALISQHGSAQVGPGYTVRDLWESRVKATMTPLE